MGQRAATYRAVQAVAPGKLELVQKPFTEPPPGHVRIQVEACGVCHSDSATVEGILPIQWPRVPGHEAVGKMIRVANVKRFAHAPAQQHDPGEVPQRHG